MTVRIERKVGLPDYSSETVSVMADTHCAEGEQAEAFTNLHKKLKDALKPVVKEMHKG